MGEGYGGSPAVVTLWAVTFAGQYRTIHRPSMADHLPSQPVVSWSASQAKRQESQEVVKEMQDILGVGRRKSGEEVVGGS